MKTQELTKTSLLLCSGIVLKYLTDTLTRTGLSILFIDPLIWITALIFIEFHNKKTVISVLIIETFLSLTLFSATDMWFVRPFIVLLCYLITKIVHKRKWSIKTKYLTSCFFTSFFTMTFMALGLLILFTILPDFSFIQQIKTQLLDIGQSGLMGSDQLDILNSSFKKVIILALVLMGTIFPIIPATINMLLSMAVAKIYKIKDNTDTQKE